MPSLWLWNLREPSFVALVQTWLRRWLRSYLLLMAPPRHAAGLGFPGSWPVIMLLDLFCNTVRRSYNTRAVFPASLHLAVIVFTINIISCLPFIHQHCLHPALGTIDNMMLHEGCFVRVSVWCWLPLNILHFAGSALAVLVNYFISLLFLVPIVSNGGSSGENARYSIVDISG